jgi:ABC-type multidrug transport system permease subunit
MNQQTIKMLKAGIFAGVLAAIIEIIISAAMTKYFGLNIDVVQLVLGGAAIGLVTLAITLVISVVIAKRKRQF